MLGFAIYATVLLASILSQELPGIPNLSVIQSLRHNYYCVLANDSSNSALTWSSQNTDITASTTILCNISTSDKCWLNDENDAWTWTVYTDFSPILDYRWEGFQAYQLDFDATKLYETNNEDFQLSFSVKFAEEVHIFLCDDYRGHSTSYGNCYWIALGAYEGNICYLRKCDDGVIPTVKYDYPSDGDCYRFKKRIDEPYINDRSRWHHFTIAKQNNVVSFWKYNHSEPILQYNDDSNVVFATNYVLARNAKAGDAYIRVHKVQALNTKVKSKMKIYFNNVPKDTCVSLLMKTCEKCSLLPIYENILNKSEAKKLGDWQEVSFITQQKDIHNQVFIEFETNVESRNTANAPYWYISDTIRQCNDRVAVKMSNASDCCYALKYPDQKICSLYLGDSTTQETNCPGNTIGKNCIPCGAISEKGICQSSKICDLTPSNLQCSCAAGYTGTSCRDTCPIETYGFDCKQKCGRCRSVCNNVDGYCQCEENFEGNTCHEAILPLVKQEPALTFIGSTNVTIKINLTYEGKHRPFLCSVQYKGIQDSAWMFGPKFSYQNTTISETVTGLKPNSQYSLRIVMHDETHKTYDGKHVPVVTFNTTRAHITTNFLTSNISSFSITLSIDNTKPAFDYTHRPDTYRIYLWEEDLLVSNQTLGARNVFNNLDPYTEYAFEIRKDDNIVADWTVMTDEAAPSEVIGVQQAVTATNLTLSWDPPLQQNGKLIGYRVQYKYIKSRIKPNPCTPPVSREIKTINVTSKTIVVLRNLLPYSVYEVNISAVNKYDGAIKTVNFKTKVPDTPSESDFPIVNVTHQEHKFEIVADWSCSTLRRFLRYATEIMCISEWCFNRTTYFSVEQIADITWRTTVYFNTTGNTKYTFRESVTLNNHTISRNRTIVAPPSAPGAVQNLVVYSKSNTSVSLRWSAPHPPTGNVEGYWIRSIYMNETKIESASECKLWPGKVCATISVHNNATYYWIKAKNLHVNEYGPEVSTTYVYHKEEAPWPPVNMSLQWDNEYNLMIRWRHPDLTNGNLVQFLLYINNDKPLAYTIREEMPQYEYKDNGLIDYNSEEMTIPSNLTAQTLSVGIVSKNSAGDSSFLSRSIDSPPRRPRFLEEPSIDTADVHNASFSIIIPALADVGNNSFMYIIITDRNNSVDRLFLNPLEKTLLEEFDVDVDHSWIAGEIQLSETNANQQFKYEIGNGVETNSKSEDGWILTNRKLKTEISYTVSLVLKNTFRQLSRHRVYRLNWPVQSGTGTRRLYYLFFLLLIPVVLYMLYRLYMRRNYSIRIPRSLKVFNRGHEDNRNEVPLVQNLATQPFTNTLNPHEIEWSFSKSIEISSLYSYVKGTIKYKELEKQFESLKKGQTKSWIQGSMDVNRTKNRFTTLPAYDHTRVILDVIDDDPNSDYINANYIDGYDAVKAYIATQGPKSCTVNDFWRMVWQEGAEYIVMLGNIVEDGKQKIEKYWPGMKSSRRFGSIVVEYVDAEITANYKVRCFRVVCKTEIRKVQQYHFQNWPDGGVPLYLQSLVPFCKRFLNAPRGKSPIVVHSSVGIGRTGSFILCDICLHMAKAEEKVDVVYHLRRMRRQRVNMVETVEQYQLVHLLLLECLCSRDTGIPCNETMIEQVESVLRDKIREEMQYLDESTWQDEALRHKDINESVPVESNKNRFSNIIPDPASMVILTPYPPTYKSSMYINAVTVDAYFMVSKYIATQNPMRATVPEFWRMVEEKQITTIVCLNELDFKIQNTFAFYPATDTHILEPLPYMEIKRNNKTTNESYDLYNLAMTKLDAQEEDVLIKLLQFKDWHYDMPHPRTPLSLLKVYEEINRLGKSSDKVLVVCYDGARACGLFVSLCFLIDRIKMEQVCDVCLAVRTVRQSRREFVQQEEQFSFLYKCALEYVSQFGMYSNFVPNTTKH